jgi:flavin-dependent dehydrogenase
VAGRRNALKANVVIVGAGPAGAAGAICCARAGLKVVVLDRERSRRERPGETLHPGAEVLLGELGVLERVLQAGFLRHEGIWVRWDGHRRFAPYGADAAGPWRGFQAWGAELDAILLEQARELGARVLQPSRALNPIISRGRVSGVESTTGRIEAGYVVDAAGSRHWLARRLGLGIQRCSPRLIARFGYREGACPGRDGVPTITADERGWTWIAEVHPSLFHWTRVDLDGWPSDGTFVPPELRGLSPRGRCRGADVTWRVVRRPAGPGFFLTGDAVAVLDPASSRGVLKAISSGMLAARAITETLSSGSRDAGARDYSEWINDQFDHDVAGLLALYGRLPKPPSWVRERGSFSAQRARSDAAGDAGCLEEAKYHGRWAL